MDVLFMAVTRTAKRGLTVLQPEVSEFLAYLCSTKGLAQNTVVAYGNDLNQFARFLEDRGASDWNVASSKIAEFLKFLVGREYEPSSQARKLAAVRSMYKYLLLQGKAQTDPSEGQESLRSVQPLSRLLMSISSWLQPPLPAVPKAIETVRCWNSYTRPVCE